MEEVPPVLEKSYDWMLEWGMNRGGRSTKQSAVGRGKRNPGVTFITAPMAHRPGGTGQIEGGSTV